MSKIGSQPMTSMQARAQVMGIDLQNLPQHIAIIMDGNGRFAQRRGLGRLIGHSQGYKTLKSVLLSAADLGIQYLTVYAFSAENWRRPKTEVSGLMKLIEEAARAEMEELAQNNVRAQAIGRLDEVPVSLQNALQEMKDSTSGNSGIVFTLAINYGGRAEIVDSIKAIVAKGTPVEEIDEALVSETLYDPTLPEPDLLIRTAGELRWSNFLIWQAAYSELYVTDVTWPEFGEDQLLDSVASYQRRHRKFGGI